MNINQVHTPERLTDETQADYRARQRMSKRLAQRTTLLWGAYSQGTYFKEGTDSVQRVGSKQRTPRARAAKKAEASK